MARNHSAEIHIPPQVRRSSFGLYEAMRIIVPGLYGAGLIFVLYWAYLWRYFEHVEDLGPIFVVLFLLSLVWGMGLYAIESPKKRRAFLENQPSRYLSTRARLIKDYPLLDDADAQRLYFFILNSYVPPAFHEKIFFFGMLYSIMTQIRRSSLWFAAVATVIAILELVGGTPLTDIQSLLLAAVVVWIVFLVYVRHNKADRKMQENYQDQLLWLEMNGDVVDGVLKRFAERQRLF